MNRFIVILLVLGVVAASLAGGYAYFFYIPEKVEKIVISGINRFGFENPTFSSLSRKKGQIILHDVALDVERFSTIEELRIQYSPFKFLINPTRAQNVIVHNLNLTGELSETLVPLIAGWTDNAQIVQSLQNFPSKKITIDSTSLDLLSNQYGGLNVRGTGEIDIHGDGRVSINAKATTKQNKLAFISEYIISVDTDKRVTFEATLKDLLIALPELSAKNGRGVLKGEYSANEEPSSLLVSGNVQLALMRWYDLPLSNVNAAFDFNGLEKNYEFDGSTFGPEEIAWKSETRRFYDTEGKEVFSSSININPKDLYDVQRYLGRNKKLGVNAYIPKVLLNIKSPNITIENLYQSEERSIIGVANVEYKQPSAQIKIEYKNDPEAPSNVVGNIEMEKTPVSLTSDESDNTQFDLSASGNFTLKNYTKKPAFLWIANTTVHNGNIDLGSINIEDIRGVLFLGGSAAKQKNRKHSLKYSFPLKNNIENKGTLSLNTNNPKKPLLEKLNLKIYEGEIRTQEPITKDGAIANKNTLDVSNINLEHLTRDAQLDGISVSGHLAGIIPYETKDAGILVTGGLLQNQDTGILRISKDITEGLFPGNSPENKILREALENYHYEFFEIRLDGDLTDRVMMTLNARGKNPDIKSKKPVDVKLQIETPISVLFDALLQQNK